MLSGRSSGLGLGHTTSKCGTLVDRIVQGEGICEVEGAGIDAHVREALSVPGGKEYAYF